MDIAFVAYPNHTPLDLIGPWEVLSRVPGAKTHLLWTRPGPVIADRGVEINATASFEAVPEPEVLLVPGGPGQLALMKHGPLLEVLRKQAASGRWLVSVCTGALLLGQAGVLRKKKATTHWLALPTLKSFGAEPVEARWIFDGNIATAAGVSAGIDVALELARRLSGDDVAKGIQLSMEYAPKPPFKSGSPATAPAKIVAAQRASSRRFV